MKIFKNATFFSYTEKLFVRVNDENELLYIYYYYIYYITYSYYEIEIQ